MFACLARRNGQSSLLPVARASCPLGPLHLQPDALLRQRLGRSPEVPSSVKGLQRKRKPIVAERENQCQQTQLINPTVALFPSILELFFSYSLFFFFLSHVFTAWLLVSALFFSSSMLTESGKKKSA